MNKEISTNPIVDVTGFELQSTSGTRKFIAKHVMGLTGVSASFSTGSISPADVHWANRTLFQQQELMHLELILDQHLTVAGLNSSTGSVATTSQYISYSNVLM